MNRSFFETREAKGLAPYAMQSGASKGRKHPEKEHAYRTAFQRDRDRIVHSTAFRRLEYKTQVFVNHEGDHYRTRLTHTLETAQISRTIGRSLGLNEDLIETIALAHDLGHGPFGHAGEWALRSLMTGHGGFEHNAHCLRLVEKLEESYAKFPGLNLTYEVREGLKKHARTRFRFMEADVVDCADEIAYNCHDLDDGLRAELLPASDLLEVRLWRDAIGYVQAHTAGVDDSIKNRTAVRLLINRLVGDLIEQTRHQISRYRIRKPSDFARSRHGIVGFSKPMASQIMELKRFLSDHLYRHFRVVRMTEKGQRIIKDIFRAYIETPEQLPPLVLAKVKRQGIYRSVCDYIAGMTDRFAINEHNRLFVPDERV